MNQSEVDRVLAQLNLPGRRVVVRPAGRVRRLLAFLADVFIIDLFVLGPLDVIVRSMRPGVVTQELYAAFTTIMFVFLGYFWLFEYLLGQTPGQLLFRLETRGVTFWRGLVRQLLFLPLMPFPLLLFIEPLFFLVSGERVLARWTGTETVEVLS